MNHVAARGDQSVDVMPEFEARPGYPYEVLPDGVHATDEPGIRARSLDRMPASQTRAAVCDGFFRLRADAGAKGICATQ